ncbi:MAG: hypothetical protein LUG17_02110 [Clostridiales bacterium]|nr:hypothetical protein [Clostridiales bacterium]
MDDFEEKLNSILSSPEAMGQIMSLASSIAGKPEGEGNTPTEETEAPQTGGSPAAEGEAPLNLLQNLDPAMVQRLMGLYREYTRGGDEKTALLQAMRPFLREERQERLDKAVRIARFSRVIRAALEQFRGERDV